MHLARARAIVDYVVANASGPVSVFVSPRRRAPSR